MSKSRLEQEVLDKLQDIIDRQAGSRSDIEGDHSIADDILCEFIIALGYDDVVAAFKRIDKWYA